VTISRQQDGRYHPKKSLTIFLSEKGDCQTDTIVRPKQVIYWPNFVTRKTRRRM